MKITVNLVSNDFQTSYGFAEIDQEYPGLPQALLWKGRAFKSEPNYGSEANQTYAEMISQSLPDDAVTVLAGR